jgi:quercetin dioxygenase-like cupin family protein
MSDETQAQDAAIGGAVLDDLEWIEYVDVHDRVHGGMVKIVNPRTFYVRFPPGFRAPEHWHPYDTTYNVTAGRIMFGDEGWFEKGSIRWVTAGHV